MFVAFCTHSAAVGHYITAPWHLFRRISDAQHLHKSPMSCSQGDHKDQISVFVLTKCAICSLSPCCRRYHCQGDRVVTTTYLPFFLSALHDVTDMSCKRNAIVSAAKDTAILHRSGGAHSLVAGMDFRLHHIVRLWTIVFLPFLQTLRKERKYRTTLHDTSLPWKSSVFIFLQGCICWT